MVSKLNELPTAFALFVESLPDHVRSSLRGIVEKALSLLIANNAAAWIAPFPTGKALQVVASNLVFPFSHLHILPFGFCPHLDKSFSRTRPSALLKALAAESTAKNASFPAA
jgi:hypothetical protein